MDYKFLFYCFLSVVLITGGGYTLVSSGQEIIAALYFLGATAAVIFFGLRWFTVSGDIAKKGATAVPWPPVINYCPDFLTLTTANNEQVCIDTVGVSTNGAMSTSDGTDTQEKSIFHLYLDQSGPKRAQSLCDQAKMKQVTWEGVWDGSTCMGVDPPKPPSS